MCVGPSLINWASGPIVLFHVLSALTCQAIYYRKMRSYALGAAFLLAVALAGTVSWRGGLTFPTCKAVAKWI